MLKRLALITLLVVLDRVDAVARRPRRGGPAAGQRRPGGAGQGGTLAPAADASRPQAAGAPLRTGSAAARPAGIFRAGINFVRVDVIATDNKGNPILDLKPEDLAVTEDGKPQAIESFKLFKVDRTEGDDAAARDSHELR